MLSAEDNELLTRIGPGSAMGTLMRRYWTPALLSEELPEPDGPPVRVTILGERLVVFRDSAGQVGLLDEPCPHRGCSLYLACNEGGGLRCIYHGWKFDVGGRCVDMPAEDEGSGINWLLTQQSGELFGKDTVANSRRLDVPPSDPDGVLDPKRETLNTTSETD